MALSTVLSGGRYAGELIPPGGATHQPMGLKGLRLVIGANGCFRNTRQNR